MMTMDSLSQPLVGSVLDLSKLETTDIMYYHVETMVYVPVLNVTTGSKVEA
jgi:hypothetical protein